MLPRPRPVVAIFVRSACLLLPLLLVAGCVRFSTAEGGPGRATLQRSIETITSRANGAMTEVGMLMAEGKPFPAMGVLGDEMDWFLANLPERCYAEMWGRLAMGLQIGYLAADFSRRAVLSGDDAALGLMPVFIASLDEQADAVEKLTTSCDAEPSVADGPVDATTSIGAILDIGRTTLELAGAYVGQGNYAAAIGLFSKGIDVLLASPPDRCYAELWGRTLLTFRTGLLGAEVSRQASVAGFQLSGGLAPVFTDPIATHTSAVASLAVPC